ncbi:PfkB family carbohydrate kinase [Actinoallomurus bryophytorum]|uniref:2-dehydro-3-deoxygluconokinase n=1 Tax=Actinoallomurus bryophytorum TaxID=1490222 RepID=A0A543CPA5_9ACTN|nr:PfkB family carbohydrate kinase [Actinoallomurus bryophytorum]TQL98800.1 2-dehydro-3-deoxygluconokinase [Actinoallomurus bryophytorum]
MRERPEVVVIGEPLVEFSASEALTSADTFRLSFSGDALNAAVAAAATGAHVALVTRTGEDEFGERLIAFAASHGIDTRWMWRGPGHSGAYAVGADPHGERAFAYMRFGSAASRLSPADVTAAPVAGAGAVLLSGITAALSDSCAAAVVAAAEEARGKVVYDPNFRGRLTTATAAREILEKVAPHAALVTPSCPADSVALLDTADAERAAALCLGLGAAAAAVTRGPEGVHIATAEDRYDVPAVAAPVVVDATGAGDAFAGVLTARLARGASLVDAVRGGAAAASVSLAGQGGTGRVATAAEIEALLSGD